MADPVSSRAAQGLERVVSLLAREAGEAEFAYFVPGRIEVLGKHIDYAGGRGLLAAADEGVVIAGRRTRAGAIRIIDAADGRQTTRALQGDGPAPCSRWEIYPDTVVRRIARDFPGVEGGVTLVLLNSLPRAAGMSSSSALVVSVFLGVADALGVTARDDFMAAFGRGLDGTREDRERLADYLAAVEAGREFAGLGAGGGVRGVGTDGGSQDHVAMVCGQPGRLVRYSFLPVRFEGACAWPDDWVFAVADSGVAANKTGGARDAFNRLAADARRIATCWRERTGGPEPHAGAILASSSDARGVLARLLDEAGEPALRDRWLQFAAETADLVPDAAAALEAGDLAAFGAVVARSQAAAEDVLGTQVPETSALVRLAHELGSPAASGFGAGFGGAVWALARRDEAPAFLDSWRARYVARFPARADDSRFLVTRPGPAAFRMR